MFVYKNDLITAFDTLFRLTFVNCKSTTSKVILFKKTDFNVVFSEFYKQIRLRFNLANSPPPSLNF